MQAEDVTRTGYQTQESQSYWHKTSSVLDLSADLPSATDVVVVGGGLLGAATTYWLARAGVAVVMLERAMPAYGATGRNGGFLTVSTAEAYPDAIARLGHETARSVLQLTLDNRKLVRRVLAEEEIACDYREPGNLSIALDENQLVHMRKTVETLQADGCPAILLDRTQVQGLVGTPLGSEIVGGMLLPGMGLLHSARLIQGLVKAAQGYGARAYQAQVQRLVHDGKSVLIQTTGGTLQVDSVVVAVNAWTGELIPELRELITPVRGQMLAYAPVAPVFPMGISAHVSSTGEYWQQTIDGTIVLGGCRIAALGHDIGVRESLPTAEVQTALEQIFPRLFPELKGLQVVQRWAGLMAFTPDYLPIVDRVPSVASAWLVGGFNGHGMPFGMRLGQLLAEVVTSNSTPEALRPFRLDRPTLKQQTKEG